MAERRTGVLDRRRAALGVARPASVAPRPPADALARRAIIENIRPTVDAGRFPIKRTVGEAVTVLADIFADGHDVIVAVLRERHRDDHAPWRETRMTPAAPGTDKWTARFTARAIGWHEYTVIAWVDRFESWRRDLRLKAGAGQDVELELLEGSQLVRDAAARADQIGGGREHSGWLLAQADALSGPAAAGDRVAVGVGGGLAALMFTYADRAGATTAPVYRVWVDRERARFGSWYEMFPRSAGRDASRSATFHEACARLSDVADMGFDVLYLPPIHPIGHSFRKGPNNALFSGPRDPGSPWAIGSDAGGHEAVEPGLGTVDDFAAFREEAERLGLEVALDLAWQCSPDHPWVREHPEWFRQRPDGTIKYAENPPKRYQDIYPLDFACEDWRALWDALLEVTMLWVSRGVRIFRVDNPHTKSFGFWEWLIDRVHARDPRVIFLSEAFTRPTVMRYLAKVGFTQSYTYFTWRNTKQELQDYFTELTASDVREYLRPNLFANTPDILHAYLQQGGRPAFEARLILAATLGASYGIYSGFELCDNRAVPGTEEYQDSEKYQIRHWDWNRPGHIKELVARVNAIRRSHPALQSDGSLRFLATDNPQIIAYCKDGTAAGSAETIMVVVNLDPHHLQHGFVQGPATDRSYLVEDLLTGTSYMWRSEWNYVRLDPGVNQGHVFAIGAERRAQKA